MKLLSALLFSAVILLFSLHSEAQTATPKGEVKGSAFAHTDQSLANAVKQAALVLPASATGQDIFSGIFASAPPTKGRVPVVLFLHGSSGLGLKAIGEWQLWLASLGVASIAPDSFALPDRITYTSPIDKDTYERIHAMRVTEITATLAALKNAPWADQTKLILAGASEGGVPVARYVGKEFAGRIIYSWSCESNYFVNGPQNAFEADQPALNVISSVDPYFSPSNAWLGNSDAKGHCADALKGNKNATIVLIPGAPHTLLNLPAARNATASFIADISKP
jgi:dienelactone hydrolase